MIQIIAGEKGKGKTKYLIEKANAEIKNGGSIVYLDKNHKHMYELNNQIRLVNAMEYPVQGNSELIGFVCGLLSGNHDISHIYIDSFLTLCNMEPTEDLEVIINKFNSLSNDFDINFVLSISRNEKELPDKFKNNVIVSL